MAIKNQGMILVVVLMLLGIMSGLAVTLMNSSKEDIKRTQTVTHQVQARGYLKGTQIWAAGVLKSDIYNINNQASAFKSVWPIIMPLPNSLEPGIEIKAILYDAQGSFYNINNISLEKNKAGFVNFRRQCAVLVLGASNIFSMPSAMFNNFIQAAAYWMSQNINSQEQYYLTLKIPYKPSHQFFVSPSELTQINYFDKKQAEFIMPYLIALPELTPINVNTASAQILTALESHMTVDKALQLIALRQAKPGQKFESIENFLSAVQNKNAAQESDLSADQLSLESRYFLLKSEIKMQQNTYIYFTLFLRDTNNSIHTEKIVWEKEGYL